VFGLPAVTQPNPPMSHHLHVVTAPDEVLHDQYLIARLAAIWRTEGHRVTVGPCPRLDADVGFVHVNRTLVDAALLPDNPNGKPLLNGSILDISKRRISTNLLTADSDYRGPVIIKTDANHFGKRERLARSKSMSGKLWLRISRRMSWRLSRELVDEEYPILDGIAAVPDWVWSRPDLVVERFLPEKDGDEFVLRLWVFFGQEEYGVRMFSPDPMVKVRSSSHHDYLTTVPEPLREVRSRLGIDFGKFDYVMVDGEPVLLDVNKTAWMGSSRAPSANLLRLATGLRHYLRK